MRTRLLISIILALGCLSLAAQACAAQKLHIRAGGYAPSASETVAKEGENEYTNGAVDLTVAKGGTAITYAGLACYTGKEPTGGLPADDEVTIKAPHRLTINASGSFAFSGPVTLTPEESQTEQSFTSTLTLKGHFQNGRIAVVGTASSPLCQPSTVTKVRLRYDPLA